MSGNWFGCVHVTPFYVAEVFLESVTWSSSCSTNVKRFAIGASYAIDYIGGGTRAVIKKCQWIVNGCEKIVPESELC